MEDFKKLPKGTPCYKEGGSVYKSRHSEKSEVSEDIAKDKKIVKKAFAMHDKQEHPGEKTNLSKLKKGGRAKKEVGTVKKYACGGGVYGAKKTKEDIKSIAAAKRCKPKMAEGGSILDSLKAAGTKLKDNTIGTPEQNRIAQEQMNRQAAKGSKLAKFFGGKADAESAPVSKSAPATAADFGTESVESLKKMGQGMGVTGQKKGGKVKGKC